ncbi:rhomboid family intramembrane serine protease [Ancylothrix sp. C2]|uniref:rhomboid family intramembrane serine protease n=1 Tax=Ancylothrix sp. D3o TaxID=2953691 RepID=UPI0021BB91F5|nr:rhomboid family intramembrane serine protease [Ancylothrix sp. D3o]MCT7951322.1 rhomboid family intramembrane serine protease [Ancylothrix sp. D3o]
MIPIADNIQSQQKPVVTLFLIGLTVAVFLGELKLELTGELTEFLQNWGVVPANFARVAGDAIYQQNPAAAIILIFMAVRSLLGGIFLHGSFAQILGNMLFLWVFGKRVEEVLGGGKFLLFYVICGVSVGLVQIFAEPSLNVPLVGANGAMAGVLGGYLLRFPRAKIETILPMVVVFVPVELPVLFYGVWWFIQQWFYGIGSLAVEGGVNAAGVGYWVHGVGLIFGACLVWVWGKLKIFRKF